MMLMANNKFKFLVCYQCCGKTLKEKIVKEITFFGKIWLTAIAFLYFVVKSNINSKELNQMSIRNF